MLSSFYSSWTIFIQENEIFFRSVRPTVQKPNRLVLNPFALQSASQGQQFFVDLTPQRTQLRWVNPAQLRGQQPLMPSPMKWAQGEPTSLAESSQRSWLRPRSVFPTTTSPRSLRFTSFLKDRTKGVPRKVKNWICYGKRTGRNSKETSGNMTAGSSIDSEIELTKILYDQQNMIKCFEERNFYRLLFAFFQSMWSPMGRQSPDEKGPFSAALEIGPESEPTSLARSHLSKKGGQQWARTLLSSLSDHQWNPKYIRWRSKKLILFGRSEVKRLFRKVLFMKSESLLFAQIFLIPLAAFFGILYTFWTFSVSSTVITKEYVPIAQQHQLKKFAKLKSTRDAVANKVGNKVGNKAHEMSSFVNGVSRSLSTKRFPLSFFEGREQVQPTSLVQPSSLALSGTEFQNSSAENSPQSWLPKSGKVFFQKTIFDLLQKIRNGWPQLTLLGAHRTFREVFLLPEEAQSVVDLSPEDFLEFEEQHSMTFTPFFTSYKVDWSPTPGLADFLRFTNTASKIFILWASLAVLRSLRPLKANRPELQIQTRFLRPFQNRKRFRDLEGIEKFSDVLTTLTESLQGSFKDPLFYIALVLPNLPFFQPFQKGIGKFRFFLFYGKQTAIFRKTMRAFISLLFPHEKQKQAQSFPKGYLFIGPPGTGKTLLAQAIAGESQVNFICLSASEIQKQVDLGTRIGALRLRNLFEEARTSTPCILFFDEIDTLGRARVEGAGSTGAAEIRKRQERDQRRGGLQANSWGSTQRSWDSTQRSWDDPTKLSSSKKKESGLQSPAVLQEIDLKLFTEFLVQMDSFSVNDGFLVIGTTNFLSSLDPAFVRSGRFDRILGLSYPPKKTRIAILKLHIHKKGNSFDSKIPWNVFGFKTKDLSPADLAKIVNESSLYLLNQLNELRSEAPHFIGGANKVGSGHDPTKLGAAPFHGPRPALRVPQDMTETRRSVPGDFLKVRSQAQFNFVFNNLGLLVNLTKELLSFKPGLTHTSQSLREGFIKILESKK